MLLNTNIRKRFNIENTDLLGNLVRWCGDKLFLDFRLFRYMESTHKASIEQGEKQWLLKYSYASCTNNHRTSSSQYANDTITKIYKTGWNQYYLHILLLYGLSIQDNEVLVSKIAQSLSLSQVSNIIHALDTKIFQAISKRQFVGYKHSIDVLGLPIRLREISR